MDLKQIRESGLLELFILGTCSQEEKTIVENALEQFSELKSDLAEIEKALEAYAGQMAVPPTEGMKEEVLREARKTASPRSPSGIHQRNSKTLRLPSWLSYLAAIALLVFGVLSTILFRNYSALQKAYENQSIICDSIQTSQEANYALLQDLQHEENVILTIQATEKYEEVELFLITNTSQRKNFIEVNKLPLINAQQSFQLWSLKDGQAPIPLTVFQGDEGIFIPVSYEEGTNTYAITIEPLGGQESPTLENLIGTVSVSSSTG